MLFPYMPSVKLPAFRLLFKRRLPFYSQLLIAAAACWLLAGQVWTLFLLPKPLLAIISSQVVDPVANLPGRHLFGQGAILPVGESATESYQLVGVMAGKKGIAIFRSKSGQSKVLTAGDEAEPGFRLLAVEKGSVRVLREGVETVLSLPKKQGSVNR
jgi:hypothetical protein